MAAYSVERLPEGSDWLYEVKWDGYRALLLKDGAQIQLRSRNDKDLTTTYPPVAAAAAHLQAARAVIDGELVALDHEGRPSFQALQHRGSHPGHTLAYYAFDVLHLNGHDLTGTDLLSRRTHLAQLLPPGNVLRESRELPGAAAEVVQAVRAIGIEGVIAKRRDSRYTPGERSRDWLKLKLDRQQEFVAGGYRPSGATGLDALLVGVYEQKRLQFAGKVRAGFTPHVRRELLRQLQSLQAATCPFANLPDERHGRWGSGITQADMTQFQWVRPALVVQLRFVEWTGDGRLRHARFLGVRNDKPARDVGRER
jgi:bifunctional non-homologous end joining protein LigD